MDQRCHVVRAKLQAADLKQKKLQRKHSSGKECSLSVSVLSCLSVLLIPVEFSRRNEASLYEGMSVRESVGG